jgi:cytochrome P450
MLCRIGERPLSDNEIVSILRNWTGGDLGSLALCTGVILAYLADHPDVQDRLRTGVADRELDAVLADILRIDDPFVSNRRVATEPVTIAGSRIRAGDLVVLNWAAANRDEKVFGDPDVLEPDVNGPYNLVYGIGKHVCPGRPLAALELRLLVRAVLDATVTIGVDSDRRRERELPPAGGYAIVPLLLG